MQVSLLQNSPLMLSYYAGKACVGEHVIVGKMPTEEEKIAFLLKLIKRGHTSVLEHVVYTFNIEGISRALLQELVRHRIASYSVESTRWALKRALRSGSRQSGLLPIPEEKTEKYPALDACYAAMDDLMDAIEKAAKAGVPNDLLKLFLPESFMTRAVVTINMRSLRNLLALRSAPSAFWEFRKLCTEIVQALPDKHRVLYTDVIEGSE